MTYTQSFWDGGDDDDDSSVNGTAPQTPGDYSNEELLGQVGEGENKGEER